MQAIRKLPKAFERYRKKGGVLDFSVYEDADGTDAEILPAIEQSLRHARTFDAEKLRLLGARRIKEKAFFGDWYDRGSGLLLMRGSYSTADGRTLESPKLKTLDGIKILGGASNVPSPGSGGEFAYAFSRPPYSLRGKPSETQAIFEEIRDFILPPLAWSDIRDWSSPLLPEVSDYFAAGMKWWGVFLFSIHIPAFRRLTIIAGSAAD